MDLCTEFHAGVVLVRVGRAGAKLGGKLGEASGQLLRLLQRLKKGCQAGIKCLSGHFRAEEGGGRTADEVTMLRAISAHFKRIDVRTALLSCDILFRSAQGAFTEIRYADKTKRYPMKLIYSSVSYRLVP